MPASFSPACDVVSLDSSVREAGLNQLQSVQGLAQSVLAQANAAALDLSNISYPSINITVDYDTSGQFPTVALPVAPLLGDVNLEITDPAALPTRTEPTAPGVSRSDITPSSIDGLPTRTLPPAPVVDLGSLTPNPIADLPQRGLDPAPVVDLGSLTPNEIARLEDREEPESPDIGEDDLTPRDVARLPNRAEPTAPVLDYSGLDFDVDEGDLSNPTLLTLSDIDRLTLRPTIYRDVVGALATKLLSIFEQVTGLPIAWEEATWARARDRLTKEQLAQEDAITYQFSAAGWDMPTGMETARIDQVRNQFIEAASGVSRDIAIKVFEEALVSLRLGMELSMRFYELWPQIYTTDINAQVEEQRNIGLQNQQLLDQLKAAIEIFDIRVRAESSTIDARLGVIESKTRVFQSEIQALSALTSRDVAQQQADVALEQLRLGALNNKADTQVKLFSAQSANFGVLTNRDVAEQSGDIDIEKVRLTAVNDGYKTRALVYDSVIKGYTAVKEGDIAEQKANIEAERIRLDALNEGLKTAADVYRSEVGGFDSTTRRDLGKRDGDIRVQEFRTGAANEAFRTEAAVYQAAGNVLGTLTQRDISIQDAALRTQQVRVAALNDKYRTQAAIHSTEVQLNDSIARRDQAAFVANTDRQRIAADVQIANNNAILAARNRDVEQSVSSARTIIDFYRQTASAIWQSTNVSLGASYGASTSVNHGRACNTSYGYSYSESAAAPTE